MKPSRAVIASETYGRGGRTRGDRALPEASPPPAQSYPRPKRFADGYPDGHAALRRRVLLEAPPQLRRSSRWESLALQWILVAGCLGWSGCCGPGRCGGVGWTDRNGVQHALILGFGVVSFTNGPITAVDASALGLVWDGSLNLGLAQKHQVEINPAMAPNAVVSIKATPFSLQVRNSDFTFTNTTDKPKPERNRKE